MDDFFVCLKTARQLSATTDARNSVFEFYGKHHDMSQMIFDFRRE